ncbi:protein phosphatase 1 regulatory subunit SDS22 homolog isoform X2 [Stylophora pistillata]|nr:protein phosphatase 1 regulatory subunit SDS22 homolog isoform X2 [Stylophora pistillata]
MFSTLRSQRQTYADNVAKFKSKSASPTQKNPGKKQSEDKRIQSSTSERELRKINVREILERCQEVDSGRVFEINLNRQSLEQVPSLKEFPKLKILDLGCNKIKHVMPGDLEKNCDLRELKLYANEITEISGLDSCKELNNLLLQHNKIKSIDKGLQHVRKLKVLRLDSNCLSKIDFREFGCCSQITILDISCNNITDISAINALPALEELDVSNNKIGKIPDLGRCKKIQDLDASKNQISDLSGMRSLSSLTVLRVDNNEIVSLDSLGKLRALQELYLSNNRITEVKLFASQFSSLEILEVSNNAITTIEELFTLSSISTLAELTVAGNPCESADTFSCHRQIFQNLPSLEFLDKVSRKRPSTGQSRAPPPMRPMSASQVLSAKHVEELIKATELEQTSFESSIASR